MHEEPDPHLAGRRGGHGLLEHPDHADPEEAPDWPPPRWLPEEYYNSALWETT